MTVATRHVVVDPQVEVDGDDLSDLISRAELVISAAEVTSFLSGDEWENYHAGGRKSAVVNLDITLDYSAAGSYATLKDLVGTLKTVKVKPKSGGPSATIPEFEVTCFINSFTPITGARDDSAPASFSVSWPVSGEPTINTS